MFFLRPFCCLFLSFVWLFVCVGGGRTQIGVLEDGVLAEHYVSRQEQASSMAGNVYLGRVQNVLP